MIATQIGEGTPVKEHSHCLKKLSFVYSSL